MSISLAEVRFQWQRALGLIRRGMTSLRARGWQATWQRVQRQLRRVPPSQRAKLYLPAETPFAPFAVPDSDRPRASVIVPVYNQVAHTLACLRALAAHPPLAACEILVVDDGSSDQTQLWMSQVQGLHFHRRAQNGGFIAACNDGAAQARGEFLVFLNNDTVPQPGWLDALLDTFRAQPEAGLVGAQLLYPDGRLQEAGGVVFSDGSAWNYGRFESPEDPRYASLRDADYCSGAAIAVPRALFASLGGFDTRYAPAYYEDTDLAFSVRAAGKRVLYQPAARVVHLEGITSGTDLNQGVKAYQVRNRELFERKWRDALSAFPAPGLSPMPATLHAHQRQILIVDEAIPQPDRDSASLRMFNLMKMLRQANAHVVFLATEHAPEQQAPEQQALRNLQNMGIEVWYPPFCSSPPAWLAEHGKRFSVILACRYYLASKIMPLARKHSPQASFVLDTIDLHYLRESRAAQLAGNEALAKSALRTRQRELAVISDADLTLVVSGMERDVLAKDAPASKVDVLSNLHEVAGPGLPFLQRRDLVFVGGFRHTPNVDAVRWFVQEVFPRVRQRLPDVAFHCIGGDVPDSIAALGKQEGVVVHGHVPNLDSAMDGMRIAVAPLRFGAGVKGKINLSMAHGQPVVATGCAVEGMHLQEGIDVLVADEAQAFADAVARLYDDEDLWNRLSRNGLENVARHFSMEAARDVVRRVFLGEG
ncbi:glycosyltransferase [Pseudoxanthomonas sacheonensis]|uniref:GT2 family glycosyltransferase n=1 Tax=Pseudoxanthomonas sacheonensis TaxID=443615 RepID=A0ABU1RW88_9GAMM|nr:glycosyltransferase [Pseudoxanthomonas sacheonensis]MDR6843048.1 GT2 family glycosyltransferase [Pseudoxanthomonas sacheonensis]